MFRNLVFSLALLLAMLPAVGFAQSEPKPEWPGYTNPANPANPMELESLDLRRVLLTSAGALIGVSLIQTLSVNPATAEWMVWLSQRLLVVFGAFVGSRLFGGFYDVWGWFAGEEASATNGGS